MKKVFLFAAMAAMVLVSCGKKDDPKKNSKDDEEADYVAPIDIDGDFSDWAKLDASKIATAKCEDGAAHDVLKVLKVYADPIYIFLYFEWDKNEISYEEDDVPVHFYINGDGDTRTGGYGDQFTDACSDVMFEGFLYSEQKMISYEPGVFKWAGEVNGTGWDDCWEDIGGSPDLCLGAGVDGKYELRIVRELYPLGKIADTFSIGMDIQQGWDSVGILPNAAGGNAPSLTVTTNK